MINKLSYSLDFFCLKYFSFMPIAEKKYEVLFFIFLFFYFFILKNENPNEKTKSSTDVEMLLGYKGCTP